MGGMRGLKLLVKMGWHVPQLVLKGQGSDRAHVGDLGHDVKVRQSAHGTRAHPVY